MKIAFIGLGKLGKECAEEIAKTHDVVGFDIKPVDVPFKTKLTIQETIKDRDIVFIAVPTPHETGYGGETPIYKKKPQDFDYTHVIDVLSEIKKYYNNQLIVLISTVLPGTIRNTLSPYIQGMRFLYNPYLIAMGSVKWDMVNPEMIIIGQEKAEFFNDSDDVNYLVDFYKSILEKPDTRFSIGTWEEAEAIKVFYNTFISTKITFVNMIQDVAERLGNMDVDVVTDALEKSTQRIISAKYMTAGGPDAGPCHPRDNIALKKLSHNLNLGYDYFGAIMEAREKQTKNLAMRVYELSKPKNLPVIIVGKAYKPGIKLTEGSGSILLEYYLNINGKTDVYYLDDYMGIYPPEEAISVPAVYVLMHNALVTYCDSPLKNQEIYHEIHPVEGSIIVDLWRQHKPFKGCQVVQYGNTRKYV